MLKRFEVSGFKNFDHTFALDFSDVRDYKFNTECIGQGLLKNIIIYGKNAIGKTNFGLAIFDIVAHLTGKNVTPGLYDYYLNSGGAAASAEFHYVFEFGSDIVDYTYKKSDLRELLFEQLVLNDELMLEQDYVTGKTNAEGLEKLAPTLNWSFSGDESLLKYALNNTALEASHPLFKWMQFVSNMLWFRNLDENRYIGYKTKSDDFLTYLFDPEKLEEFEVLLQESGQEERLCVLTDSDGKKRLYFDTPTPLPFWAAASSGTKALYTFFYWYKTSPELSFLFIDEFDAYYHYEMSERIVVLLEKLTGVQVILTSHNTNLLTNRIMRPDCYFLLSKDRLTSLANATKRELREGHNLEKLYMSGEFDE